MILLFSVFSFINNLFLQIELNSLKYYELFGFQAWVQGVLSVLFLYHFLFFFQNKNRMFLYYSAFVFCLLVYFAHYVPKMFYVPDISYVSVTLFYGIQFLAYFFYICYVREVLNTKVLIPEWDTILQLAKKILLIFIVIVSISSLFLSTIEIFTLVVLLFYCFIWLLCLQRLITLYFIVLLECQ
ncbi:7TM diverse intracellular signaling domain-containing protein [Aquimarina agarilytica]|uniref:7TM diverse intracellular signaling domain-containing protein n=1 Tax=Aquimarina agarilytica TaxID=1087449 RepID=UPI0009D99570